jgi:hypothetical protein
MMTVILPMECTNCEEPFNLWCEQRGRFSVMLAGSFPCPRCEEVNHFPKLPGEPVSATVPLTGND